MAKRGRKRSRTTKRAPDAPADAADAPADAADAPADAADAPDDAPADAPDDAPADAPADAPDAPDAPDDAPDAPDASSNQSLSYPSFTELYIQRDSLAFPDYNSVVYPTRVTFEFPFDVWLAYQKNALYGARTRDIWLIRPTL